MTWVRTHSVAQKDELWAPRSRFTLDTHICSERRWPLRSTAFSDRRPEGCVMRPGARTRHARAKDFCDGRLYATLAGAVAGGGAAERSKDHA
jgi:hypothetical protein